MSSLSEIINTLELTNFEAISFAVVSVFLAITITERLRLKIFEKTEKVSEEFLVNKLSRNTYTIPIKKANSRKLLKLINSFNKNRYYRKKIALNGRRKRSGLIINLQKALNASLISALIINNKKDSRNENQKTKTVVELMITERVNHSFKSKIYLLAALFLAYIIPSPQPENSTAIATIIIALILTCMQIDQSLLRYRIKKGWYGQNTYESEEIIKFILSHPRKDDFNDSNGLKGILPKGDISTTSKPIKESDIGGKIA
ncbi:hypothetical protein GCM10011297_32980 [Bacterioplanes sanyensis]|uniref:hypothetical protein n=1 Tax=Bacterioplanes sanyensis TaxID=1249553 RepID=UPI00167C1E30|nr:hypothetical protein [Bacterioplanes sanyensis]GGY57644.1 hypothetical protein GCM10011297_32980 [Bacterioplanes sanyensis]